MRIAVGSDHAGFKYKNEIIKYLTSKGYEVKDVGTYSETSCDYPEFSQKVGYEVVSGNCQFGVLVCCTGEGIMIAANKIKGIRCGLAYNEQVAGLMRRHNNCNVVAFGQDYVSLEEVYKRLDIFLNTKFEGGRHEKRVNMIEK